VKWIRRNGFASNRSITKIVQVNIFIVQLLHDILGMDRSVITHYLLTRHTRKRAKGNEKRYPDRILRNIEPGMAND